MNNYGYSNPNYGYNSSPMYNPITTNVIRVTSLDEAIMQTTKRPSDMVYFNQDKNEFYNVKVDYDGRKSWATFPYTLPNSDETTPVSKADIANIVSRVEILEAKLGGTVNAEPNG